MTKKNFYSIIVAICGLCYNATAQKINFIDTTNIWYSCDNDPVNQSLKKTWVDRISKDTSINGQKYYYHTRYYIWMREEQAAQRVLYKPHPDSTERIFMDYKMAVGDTLNFMEHQKIVLTSLDSVKINGTYHLEQAFGNTQLKIIEGVGPNYYGLSGIEYPYHPICCFSNKGIRPVIEPGKAWFDNTGSCTLSISKAEAQLKKVVVVPNPIHNEGAIILPYKISRGTISIINAMGAAIISKAIDNQSELKVTNLVPGIYHYTIFGADGQLLFSGKFAVE